MEAHGAGSGTCLWAQARRAGAGGVAARAAPSAGGVAAAPRRLRQGLLEHRGRAGPGTAVPAPHPALRSTPLPPAHSPRPAPSCVRGFPCRRPASPCMPPVIN